MKKYLVLITALLSLAATSIGVKAAAVGGVYSAGNTNLALGQVYLTSLTLVNTNTTTAFVRLFDAPYVLTNVLAAYVTRAEAASEVVTEWIDVFGNTNSITNQVLSSTLTTNAASTNFYPLAYSVLVNTNTTLQVDFTTPLFFQNGLHLSNNATLGITANVLR